MMQIDRYNSLVILSALAASTANAEPSKSVEKPNILVVVCEDISSYLGCYGDKVAVTPHLDHFSSEGILHSHMFTCVGVSAPSRYSLITGRYSSTDGANYMRSNYFNKDFEAIPPSEVKCYTELLRANGYYCTNNAKTDYQFKAPVAAWDEQGGKAHWKNTPEGMPFLSIFNLNVTHESFIWKNGDKSLTVNPADIILPPYYPDNEIVRHDMAVMYSNIAKMDKQFQNLLDEVEAAGIADNTIIIFYSDNGGPLPRGKRELKDSGTKVPFMIRFPDRRGAGTINPDLNMFVDIPATILSLAGVEIPKYLHGQPMYGKLASKTPKRKYVYGATDRFDEQIEKRASIRDSRYQYIYNYMPEMSIYKPVAFRLQMPMMRNMLELYEADKLDEKQRLWFDAPAAQEELYDCIADPHQVNNLATRPEYSSLLKKMRKSYRKEWIDAYNKDWERFTEQEFIDRMWKTGTKPQTETPVIKLNGNQLSVENLSKGYSISYQINGKGLQGYSEHWMLYTFPVLLHKGDEISIVAERLGYEKSEIVSFAY